MPFRILQTLFTREVAAVFASIKASRREIIHEILGIIFEGEAATKVRLDRLVGDNFGTSESNAAVSEAARISGASGAGQSKLCLSKFVLIEILFEYIDYELVYFGLFVYDQLS